MGDTYDDPFDGPVHGFLRDRSGFTQFDFPDASLTSPYVVNNRGMEAGVFTAFNIFTSENERSGYVTIDGFPYQVYANVFGMNDNGQIVGSYFDLDRDRTVGYVATLPK